MATGGNDSTNNIRSGRNSVGGRERNEIVLRRGNLNVVSAWNIVVKFSFTPAINIINNMLYSLTHWIA